LYLIPYQVPVLLAPMIIYGLDNNRRDTDVWRLLYREVLVSSLTFMRHHLILNLKRPLYIKVFQKTHFSL